MQSISVARPKSRHGLTVLREPQGSGLWSTVKAGLPIPRRGKPTEVLLYQIKNLPNMLRDVWKIALALWLGGPAIAYGVLRLKKFCSDGRILDLGVVSHQLITTAGVNKIVSGLNASDGATFQAFKFHGFGTGTTGPANGDTTLQTEATTQYATDNTRPTGSQTTGGSANVYRSVGTFTPDAAYSPTETGLFSAASAGTLLDRFTYTAVALNGSGDSLQTTIDITVAAGG